MKKPFLSAVLAAAFTLPGASQAAGEAKNIIFFLGDGMGPATVTATRLYKVGEAGKLNMETLPRVARIKTYSNDAQTTDSAPSMAAYMTGFKMNNEVLSMSSNTLAVAPSSSPYKNNCSASNGTPVSTILELAKASGIAFLTVNEESLEKDDLDFLIERIQNSSNMSDDDMDEAKWLRAYVGKCGFIQLGFSYHGMMYLHEVATEWFERYQQLLDTADDFGRLLMDQEDLRDDDEF